jgi:hypothetical protein
MVICRIIPYWSGFVLRNPFLKLKKLEISRFLDISLSRSLKNDISETSKRDQQRFLRHETERDTGTRKKG